jgi:c(7)-type cytochrome triheme protein
MKTRVLFSTVLILTAVSWAWSASPDLIFNHSFHVQEMGVSCTECHTSVTSSNRGTDDLLPEMDACLNCHDGDTAGEECALCHRTPDDPPLLPRIRDYSPLFPHVVHTARMDCDHCHGEVAAAKEVGPRHLPAMSLCMTCHETPGDFSGCLVCHTPTEELRPLTHNLGWKEDHGVAETAQCGICHRKSQCEDCHLGTAGVILYHEENQLLQHGLDYLVKGESCFVCHREQSVCLNCHENSGARPLTHGGDYILVHGADASVDPRYCLLCHGGGDGVGSCSECH